MPNRYRTALILSGSLLCAVANPAAAQVSGTEVNQQAVDDFGLERKTGRFSWSTGEVIGIGGEGSRVSIEVTGVRNPPRATRIWPAPFTSVILNEPRLLSEPMPDRGSTIAGAILPNAFSHSVTTPIASETFECLNGCISEYFTGSQLDETPGMVTFTSRGGVKVFFEAYQTRILYPDGRETIFRSGQYRSNNFGFMLKHSGGGIQAVNQSVDYCDKTLNSPCAGLSENRSASFATPSVGVAQIVDARGGTTALRWENKSAKRYLRPQGAPASLFIPDDTERYPLGIKLPGSATEDITIDYHPHDPNLDTHDDIRISSIAKHGVTSTYAYDLLMPQGFPESAPSASETLDSLFGDGGLQDFYQGECSIDIANGVDAISSSACGAADSISALLPTLQALALEESFPDPPDDNVNYTSNGYNLLEMRINQSIDGEAVGSSFAVKPAGGYANKRRRLLEIVDGIGRTTKYRFNQFEEVAGQISPEGNGVVNGFDGQGNLISSTVFPKPVTNGQPSSDPLTTTYEYPTSCDNLSLAVCSSPISMTDPMGNVTDYEYNQYGQVTKEMAPAPASGEARPTVINEYALRTAFIKDASGAPVAAGPPISMLVKSFSCISSAVCDANTQATDKVVTEYDYGPTTGLNNLLLRGMSVTAANAAGQLETRLTCYTYNYFGEQISETLPEGNANLTSCPA